MKNPITNAIPNNNPNKNNKEGEATPKTTNRKDKKTMNTKTTQTNPFTQLLRTYEHEANPTTRTNDQTYTDALQALAKACTYSVLKKLCNVGGEVKQGQPITDSAKAIRQLRQAVTADIHNLATLDSAKATATARAYDKDGNEATVVADRDAYNKITKLINENLSDGYDLLQTATLAILEATQAQTEAGLSLANWTETPYTVRRLKRKVYIKLEDSKGAWEEVSTTPIQEVYKAVRREIEQNRSMQIANNKYTYIESIAEDAESGEGAAVYLRLPKYSQLADEVTDYNGKPIAITATLESVADTEKLIERMNLSKQQAQILQYRLSGYGYKAIATALGVKKNSVINQVKRIADKARDEGLTPTN